MSDDGNDGKSIDSTDIDAEVAAGSDAEALRVRPHYIRSAIGTLILVLLISVVWLWTQTNVDQRPTGIWAETTHEFDPNCDVECPEIMEPRPIGHGGESGLTFSMRTDPRLDDPIAQWGMCMDSVFTCIGVDLSEDADERADMIRQCVAHSSCPETCKSHFAEEATGDLESVAAAFESNFIEETAWCSPSR